MAQLTLSLIAIVGLILAIGWMLKRLKLAGPRGTGELAVIDQVTVGPRERVVLVRVGESQALIGIGASGLVSLSPLATPIVLQIGTQAAAFAGSLRCFIQRT